MMDVGGSMDPFTELVSRLFSAASRATHFKELRTYYFHNCVYGSVYTSAQLSRSIALDDLMAECGKHYKLILVGDALMAPYELLSRGGAISLYAPEEAEGIVHLMKLAEHFQKSAWLNPEPRQNWYGTAQTIRRVFEMFPLTLEGLGEAVMHLTRGITARGAA